MVLTNLDRKGIPENSIQCAWCLRWGSKPGGQVTIDGVVVKDWIQYLCPFCDRKFFGHKLYRGDPRLKPD